jgi:hypothetical protein
MSDPQAQSERITKLHRCGFDLRFQRHVGRDRSIFARFIADRESVG